MFSWLGDLLIFGSNFRIRNSDFTVADCLVFGHYILKWNTNETDVFTINPIAEKIKLKVASKFDWFFSLIEVVHSFWSLIQW